MNEILYLKKMIAMGGDDLEKLADAIELSPRTLENALMRKKALGKASMIRLEAYLLKQKDTRK